MKFLLILPPFTDTLKFNAIYQQATNNKTRSRVKHSHLNFTSTPFLYHTTRIPLSLFYFILLININPEYVEFIMKERDISLA